LPSPHVCQALSVQTHTPRSVAHHLFRSAARVYPLLCALGKGEHEVFDGFFFCRWLGSFFRVCRRAATRVFPRSLTLVRSISHCACHVVAGDGSPLDRWCPFACAGVTRKCFILVIFRWGATSRRGGFLNLSRLLPPVLHACRAGTTVLEWMQLARASC
jgi:hypothetical protein